jgi:hypothetical protein
VGWFTDRMRLEGWLVLLAACHGAARAQVTVPAATPVAEPVAASPVREPIEIGEVLGDFGCPGWSPSRHVALHLLAP